MKNVQPVTGKIIEYCIIIAIFAVPPVFAPKPAFESHTANIPAFFSPLPIIFYALISVFLYLRTKTQFSIKKNGQNSFSAPKAVYTCGGALLCCCALIISAFFWNYIARIAHEVKQPPLVLPKTFGGRFLFFTSAIVLASYEELLFRFFLPECGLFIVRNSTHGSGKSKIPPARVIAAELIPIVLFTLAHRYLGVYAAGNALCAAVILRFALYKKLHIGALCAVHGAYNIAVFIVLSRTPL